MKKPRPTPLGFLPPFDGVGSGLALEPLVSIPDSQPREPMPRSSVGGEPCVLLIDDDVTMVDVLRDAGCFVSTAANGTTARAVHPEIRLDLVVLEIMLPDEDGLVLCSDISRAGTPVMVCSGTRRKRDAVLALRLGAYDFIQKPFDCYEFIARFDNALGRPRRWPPSLFAATL